MTKAKGKDLISYLFTPTESQTLAAVLDMLRLHPKVGLCWRANTGQMSMSGRDVRFGFTGQADILGCLKGGRFFALEVKSPSGRLSTAQERFLSNVRQTGGLAGLVRSVDEAKLMLDMAHPGTHVANHRAKAFDAKNGV